MKVPVYGSPQVRQRPVATPRVGPDARGAFGEEAGQGLQNLGAGLTKAAGIVQAAREKAEDTDTAAAEAALQRRGTERFWGEGGLLSQKGKAAAEDAPKAMADLEKAREELAAKLPSERARALFRARTSGTLEDLRRTGARHESQEREAALAENVQALQAEGLRTAALAYSDPKLLARVTAAPEGYMDKQGATPEAREAAKTAWRGKVAATAIEAALAAPEKDVDSAAALYAANRELLGEAGPRIAKQIELVRTHKEAGVTADRIIGSSTLDATGWLDEGTAWAQVNAMEPGPQRDLVEDKVRARVTQAAATKREKVAGVYTQAFSAYYQGPGRGRAKLEAIPLATRRWLTTYAPDEWEKIEVRANADEAALRAGRGGGENQPTLDQRRAYAALAFDVQENPGKYADPSYSGDRFTHEWGNQLHLSDYKAGVDKVAGMKGKANAGDNSPGLPPAITRLVIDEGKAAGAGFSHRPWRKWGADEVATFHWVGTELEKFAAEHRRANPTRPVPTEAEYREALKPLMAEVVIPGRLFHTRVPLATYMADPDYADERAAGKGLLGGKPIPPVKPPAATPTSGVDLTKPATPVLGKQPMTAADYQKVSPEGMAEAQAQREQAVALDAQGFGRAGGAAGESARPAKVATIQDVPPAHRTAIEAALRKAKRPVTDSAVLALYLQRHRPTGP